MPRLKYLSQGKQTQFTKRVYEHAQKVKEIIIDDSDICFLPKEKLSIYQTGKYILNKLDRCHSTKKDIFRKRTLDEILQYGLYPTCSDIGIVFRGLMAAQHYPTSYIETFHEDFILDVRPREAELMTHSLGKLYFNNGSSILIDPTFEPFPKIYFDEESLFKEQRLIIFKEGLDSWDIGIKGYKDILKLKEKNFKKILNKYDKILKKTFKEI